MLDIDMPQGSGMDVLRELAKTQTNCRSFSSVAS